jgi:hypothetical protein
MNPKDKIVLHDIEGTARRSGTDQHGNHWIEFEVDHLAQQESGNCSICSADLLSGWMCLDGGDEVCDEHVEFEEGRGS